MINRLKINSNNTALWRKIIIVSTLEQTEYPISLPADWSFLVVYVCRNYSRLTIDQDNVTKIRWMICQMGILNQVFSKS